MISEPDPGLTPPALAFAFWKSPFSSLLIAAWNETRLLPVARTVDATDLFTLPAHHYLSSARQQHSRNRRSAPA